MQPLQAIQGKEQAEEDAKIPKAVALYINKGGKYTCAECVFYKEKKCALYGPTVAIQPYGGCNLWVKGTAAVPWIGGVTKRETGYMENKEGFSCKRCEEFIPEKRACEKINKNSPGDDPGQISPNGCCNRWEKK